MYEIDLPNDLQEWLDFLSRSTDKDPEDIIIEALESYFNAPFSENTPEETPDTSEYTVIASEPLTDYAKEWKEVPNNHFLYIDSNHQMHITSFDEGANPLRDIS